MDDINTSQGVNVALRNKTHTSRHQEKGPITVKFNKNWGKHNRD